MAERNPSENEVSVSARKDLRAARVFLSSPFRQPFPPSSTILPCRDSPRRVPTRLAVPSSSGSSTGSAVDYGYLTPSHSRSAIARSHPRLSRLGQYRKRLTCTLTRIHAATCSPSNARLSGARAITCDTNRLFIDIETVPHTRELHRNSIAAICVCISAKERIRSCQLYFLVIEIKQMNADDLYREKTEGL